MRDRTSGIERERERDRQTYRHIDRQKVKRSNKWDRKRERQTDRQTYRHIDRQKVRDRASGIDR